MKYSKLWLMLTSLLVGTLIGTMGNSMVSIALPSLMEIFSIPLSTAAWSLTLYTLTFSVFIPIFGSIGSAIGYKRLFTSGMLLVLVSSIFCVYSPNFTYFIITRFFFGVGIATVLPSIMGIVKEFPSEIQGKATGMWAMTSSIGHAFGPMIGGLILGYFGWQYIFWANIPLGIISIVMTLIVFPKNVTIPNKGFDWIGAAGMTVLVFSLMFGISQIAKFGFGTLSSILIIASGIIIAFLIYFERTRLNAFLDLSLFRNKTYMAAVIPISLQGFSQFGLLVSLPIFLINIQLIQDKVAGFIIMAMTLIMAFISPVAGRLSDKYDSRKISTLGIVFIFLGAVVGLLVQFVPLVYIGWILFIFSLILFGTGFGLIQSSSTLSAIRAVSKEKNGSATGFFHMIRFISGSIGSTVFGLILELNQKGMMKGYFVTFPLLIALALISLASILTLIKSTSISAKTNFSEKDGNCSVVNEVVISE